MTSNLNSKIRPKKFHVGNERTFHEDDGPSDKMPMNIQHIDDEGHVNSDGQEGDGHKQITENHSKEDSNDEHDHMQSNSI
mmetsp:Transcript_15870/g.24422  ORF Transcript_15870/g.24422 Transcript_15870/m.24422 type:complete len:80 (-) Transcript_15870:1308-1547(-)